MDGFPIDELGQIGDTLRASGYNERQLTDALGRSQLGPIQGADVPVHSRRLVGKGPLEPLGRCFLLGLSVPQPELDGLLGETCLDALDSIGWLVKDGEGLRASVRITPAGSMLIAHDPEDGGELAADHVTGVGPAPRTLLALTMRGEVESALDIGTGCGVQALFLARHVDKVVASDVNPRALQFGRTNAALNRIGNIDWRVGSLFEPVQDEKFDLIIANPPFVQSPDHTWIFRDGGSESNICEKLISQVQHYLTDSGYCQALISWANKDDSNWQDEPHRWLADTECDAWLLHYQSNSGTAYAATWNSWLRESNPERYADTIDRWSEYYEREKVTSLSVGAIMIRKSTNTPFWHADTMYGGPERNGGEQIRHVFESHKSGWPGWSDEQFLQSVPQFSGGHRLDQRMRWREESYTVEYTRIILEDSAGVGVDIPPTALLVILAIDGIRTASDLILEAGLDDSDAKMTVATLREMARLGIIFLSN